MEEEEEVEGLPDGIRPHLFITQSCWKAFTFMFELRFSSIWSSHDIEDDLDTAPGPLGKSSHQGFAKKCGVVDKEIGGGGGFRAHGKATCIFVGDATMKDEASSSTWISKALESSEVCATGPALPNASNLHLLARKEDVRVGVTKKMKEMIVGALTPSWTRAYVCVYLLICIPNYTSIVYIRRARIWI
ncbi:hypothetical protein GOP47_0017466 [Adiantum capillus-veneris]|uniref:Uncharacterized protein n=1 Tax=Adiantum capillus-veneris TaxID=13818 RepID=A0A9D4Z972_ADICA|nr:hypothetical protein GOP47_0017466 [Adiantum capillus-veneris]